MDDDDLFSVENSLDLLLVLFYAPAGGKEAGEPIEGVTRLQKLMYLLQRGSGPKALVKLASEYEFRAYRMGPFAEELNEDVNSLISLGLARTEPLKYLLSDDGDQEEIGRGLRKERVVESLRYCLTSAGMQAGEELWKNMRAKDREGLGEFKRFFCSLSLRQLLIFVYEKFPEMTEKSEIRRQLGL